ncbi:unnamed protein product [Paramecium sonneborni]|uniref:Uncharacterized protein n=1 Tax=Paramecium sonneborni TaxID=65129 RepID=A0A8S1QEH5_9CILI|nr:unnamed protein product [Paramecium sonneborni]
MSNFLQVNTDQQCLNLIYEKRDLTINRHLDGIKPIANEN